MGKQKKTNAMRILDQHKVAYQAQPWSELPEVHPQMYKTLVTVGKSNEHYVFVVPIDHELDLKKAANAVDEKNIHMIKEKELLPLTGYVHGGCSPLGMKKKFTTVIDDSIQVHELILVSGGQVGLSIEIAPIDLAKVVDAKIINVRTDE